MPGIVGFEEGTQAIADAPAAVVTGDEEDNLRHIRAERSYDLSAGGCGGGMFAHPLLFHEDADNLRQRGDLTILQADDREQVRKPSGSETPRCRARRRCGIPHAASSATQPTPAGQIASTRNGKPVNVNRIMCRSLRR